jgi:hypothetical protein
MVWSIFTLGMHRLQLLPISYELLVTLNEVKVVPRIRIDIPFQKHRGERSSIGGNIVFNVNITWCFCLWFDVWLYSVQCTW